MAGLVPDIHVRSSDLKFVDALTRPGMTRKLEIPPKTILSLYPLLKLVLDSAHPSSMRTRAADLGTRRLRKPACRGKENA
jgi:hypothetical protein